MSVWSPPTPAEKSLELQRRPPPRGLVALYRRWKEWTRTSKRYKGTVTVWRIGTFIVRIWTQHGMPMVPSGGKPGLYIGNPELGDFDRRVPPHGIPRLFIENESSANWSRFRRRLGLIFDEMDRPRTSPPKPPMMEVDATGKPSWHAQPTPPQLAYGANGTPHWLPQDRQPNGSWLPRAVKAIKPHVSLGSVGAGVGSMLIPGAAEAAEMYAGLGGRAGIEAMLLANRARLVLMSRLGLGGLIFSGGYILGSYIDRQTGASEYLAYDVSGLSEELDRLDALNGGRTNVRGLKPEPELTHPSLMMYFIDGIFSTLNGEECTLEWKDYGCLNGVPGE